MNAIETFDAIDTITGDWQGKTTEELHGLFYQRRDGMAQFLLEMAAVVKLCDQREADQPEMSPRLLTYLRSIYRKTLLPAALLKFTGSKLLGVVAALDPQCQQVVVNAERLPLGIKVDGSTTHTMELTQGLTPAQLEQICAVDHIRSDEEQIKWLRSDRGRAARASREMSHEEEVVIRTDRIIVRGFEITHKQLMEYARLTKPQK